MSWKLGVPSWSFLLPTSRNVLEVDFCPSEWFSVCLERSEKSFCWSGRTWLIPWCHGDGRSWEQNTCEDVKMHSGGDLRVCSFTLISRYISWYEIQFNLAPAPWPPGTAWCSWACHSVAKPQLSTHCRSPYRILHRTCHGSQRQYPWTERPVDSCHLIL